MPIVDGTASKAAEWEKYIVSRWAKVVLEMLEEGDPDVTALFFRIGGSGIPSFAIETPKSYAPGGNYGS